ncbi:MAG: DUF5018 domain-containing protein, partial [Bacteroides sp.]|nr:DUF5018 domain-containing protein [Bacteroides sp.]
FIITTETVGPASIRAICINGVELDYIEVNGDELIPYIPALLNFASADVEIEVGFGNKIDEEFTGKGMNLLTGENKVKVTGTNGVVTEFTIGVPQLSFAPLFASTYAELESDGFAANDLTAVGFSGNYVVATNYTSPDKAPVYFDLSGQKQGSLNVAGTTDPAGGHGYRNLATDDTGNILAAHLGTTAGEQWIYRWNSVTAQSEPYISYSKASLGVDYHPRAAGISISGSLDGNAVITVPVSQSNDVFVWTVAGGTLNPTPKKYGASLAGNYYWAVQPMPVGMNGYIAFTSGFGDYKSGITCLNSEMEEIQGLSGMIVTDGHVFRHNDRIYLAYIAFNGTKAIMRFCDITSGELSAYSMPIFQQEMSQTGANGNGTMGTDMAVIDGKLHVAFACTNLGLYVYRFD